MGRQQSACEINSQTNNMYLRAARKWQVRKNSRKGKWANRTNRQAAAQTFYALQKLAGSKAAKDNLKDLCTQDYFRRAIYRHQAQYGIAVMEYRGHAKVMKKKSRLVPFKRAAFCAKAMFRAVQPAWKSGGKKLKHSRDYCRRSLEKWKSKQEIAHRIMAKLVSHRHCRRAMWNAELRRARFTVEAIKINCKKHFGRTAGKDKVVLRKLLRKRVAEYVYNSLSSHGTERFQDSKEELAKDPVFQRAARRLRTATKAYNAAKNAGQ